MRRITRQKNKQGKQIRVMLCITREDYEAHCEKAAEDILGSLPDAVIYTPFPDDRARDKEYRENVVFMQLLVAVVTKNLLESENSIEEETIKLAQKNHVPVMFLQCEDGITDLFNDKYGSLQLIDMEDEDPTARSYREKLNRYMQSNYRYEHLDEHQETAFDYLFFLSYRKKDRAYIDPLMRMIHSSPEGENVRFWYDEFLEAGEDFHEDIRLHIEKSDVVILVITPNLVNENNYVASMEYPLAMELGKPVLPIMVSDTDPAKVREVFPGIAKIYDFRETERIMEFVRTLCRKERRECTHAEDLRKLYYRGQAYLQGNYVERDREKALSILEEAAAGGFASAMRQLCYAYGFGSGGAEDLKKGIYWGEEYIKNICPALDNEDALNRYKDVIDGYESLFDLYKKCGRSDQMLDCCHKQIDIHNRYKNQVKTRTDKIRWTFNMASYLFRLGTCYERSGEYEKAYDYLLKAENMRQQAAKELNTQKHLNEKEKSLARTIRKDRIGMYAEISRCADKMGDSDAAYTWSRKILKEVEGDGNRGTRNVRYTSVLCGYWNQGKYFRQTGQREKALDMVSKGRKILQEQKPGNRREEWYRWRYYFSNLRLTITPQDEEIYPEMIKELLEMHERYPSSEVLDHLELTIREFSGYIISKKYQKNYLRVPAAEREILETAEKVIGFWRYMRAISGRTPTK